MSPGPQCRVVLDNDWAGDPDGLVALAHHLLSPTNRVDLVTSSFLNPVFEPLGTGARRGAELARDLLGLIGASEDIPVLAGAERPLQDAEAPGAAALAIVAEARRDDPLPLMVVCGGPLTNIAQALRLAPDVVDRLTLVWVGGTLAADAWEYNRETDRAAADEVLARPGLRLRSFPLEAYERCAVSRAELEHDLGGSGVVGRWLWDRFVTLPIPEGMPVGGTWALGDSPPILLTALTDASSTFEARPSPGEHRVCTQVDLRLVLGDLLARLRLHEAARREQREHLSRKNDVRQEESG
ncbi:nucleoside hydrolase [uncultured Amnibacterium sp.]|uniref:nucleoside hydrolase n=1 Tax=uncultured Amnibacterium sp. TaxID=1631851 RepID=UPI0035C9B573